MNVSMLQFYYEEEKMYCAENKLKCVPYSAFVKTIKFIPNII